MDQGGPRFVALELFFSTKPFVDLFSVIDHYDADLFSGVVYLIDDAIISHAEFVGIDRGKFFGAENSWVFFK